MKQHLNKLLLKLHVKNAMIAWDLDNCYEMNIVFLLTVMVSKNKPFKKTLFHIYIWAFGCSKGHKKSATKVPQSGHSNDLTQNII